MSRWAIILGAIAALVMLGQAPESQGMAHPRPSVKGEAAQHPDGNPRPIPKADEPVPIRIIEDSDQTFHAQDREAKTDQHDSEDLEAQKRSATATENQVIPTWAAALLSFAATVLIAWTLWETRRYNRKQLRAYVCFKIEVVPESMGGNGFKVQIRYINTGQTPAMNFTPVMKMDVSPPNPSGEFFKLDIPEDVDFSVGYIGGNLEGGGVRNFEFTEGKFEDIQAGKLQCFVFGYAAYEDIFDNRHVTKYRLHLYRGGGLGHFYVCGERGCNSMT